MTESLLCRIRLNLLIRGLRALGRMPAHIEISPIGSVFMANVYSGVSSPLVQESVSTGLAATSDLALLKALTEFVERQALCEAGRNGFSACQTPRSDGIAAFPLVFNFSGSAAHAARANAYSEAIERFVWATWWDDLEISFDQSDVASVTSEVAELLAAIDVATPLRRLHVIRPACSLTFAKVFILIAELQGGGFVSGGAAGIGDDQAILFRASSELLRHSVAISRIRQGKANPESFYERRLAYFGLGLGDKLVRARLSRQGTKTIELPALKFDTPVPHSLSHLVAVHRCYFENQPQFIGGELERLCV